MNDKLKRENRIASEWLLYLPDRRKELQQRREDIEGRSPSSSIAQGFGGDGGISDKTGQAASQLSELEHKESWVKLLECIEVALPESRRVFLEVRRESRDGRAWTSRAQQHHAVQMSERCNQEGELMHRNTFYRWWQELVDLVVREAIRKGLL